MKISMRCFEYPVWRKRNTVKFQEIEDELKSIWNKEENKFCFEAFVMNKKETQRKNQILKVHQPDAVPLCVSGETGPAARPARQASQVGQKISSVVRVET